MLCNERAVFEDAVIGYRNKVILRLFFAGNLHRF